MSTKTLPVTVAQWSRNAKDTVMIRIDQFNGTTVIDIRSWRKSTDGELRPGRSGITMSVRHIPALASALTNAETTARQLGLLTEPNHAEEV
jgi:hypothetical protein